MVSDVLSIVLVALSAAFGWSGVGRRTALTFACLGSGLILVVAVATRLTAQWPSPVVPVAAAIVLASLAYLAWAGGRSLRRVLGGDRRS